MGGHKVELEKSIKVIMADQYFAKMVDYPLIFIDA
jgi:hypothetical protein